MPFSDHGGDLIMLLSYLIHAPNTFAHLFGICFSVFSEIIYYAVEKSLVFERDANGYIR